MQKTLTSLQHSKKYLRLTNDFAGKDETTAVINNKIVNLTTFINPVALDSIYSLLKDDRDFANLNEILSNGIKNYYNRICNVNTEDDIIRVIEKLRKDVDTYEKKIQLFNNGVKDDKYEIYVSIANICNTKIYELNNKPVNEVATEVEVIPTVTQVQSAPEPVAAPEPSPEPVEPVAEPVAEAPTASVAPAEPEIAAVSVAPTPSYEEETIEEEPTDPLGKVHYEIVKWDISKENNVGNAASRVESILNKLTALDSGSSKGGGKLLKGKKDSSDSSANIGSEVDLLMQKLWQLINMPKFHIEFADYIGTKNYIQTSLEIVEGLKCCKCEEFAKLKKFAVDVNGLAEIRFNFKKKKREFKEWQNFYDENRNNGDVALSISMFDSFKKDDAVKDLLYTADGGSNSGGLFKGLIKKF
jgi:hypothetical protein